MANNQTPKLKAFVRIDGSGRVIPGAPIFQASKPKVGTWREIPLYYRGDGRTTTTTTTASPSTTTTTTTEAPSTTTTTTTSAFTSIPVYTHSGTVGVLCTDPSSESTLTVLSSTPTLQVGSYVTDLSGNPLMGGAYITAQSGGGVFRSMDLAPGTLEAVSC